jgi:hypothetical protein
MNCPYRDFLLNPASNFIKTQQKTTCQVFSLGHFQPKYILFTNDRDP